jgi:hypothetical protein
MPSIGHNQQLANNIRVHMLSNFDCLHMYYNFNYMQGIGYLLNKILIGNINRNHSHQLKNNLDLKYIFLKIRMSNNLELKNNQYKIKLFLMFENNIHYSYHIFPRLVDIEYKSL